MLIGPLLFVAGLYLAFGAAIALAELSAPLQPLALAALLVAFGFGTWRAWCRVQRSRLAWAEPQDRLLSANGVRWMVSSIAAPQAICSLALRLAFIAQVAFYLWLAPKALAWAVQPPADHECATANGTYRSAVCNPPAAAEQLVRRTPGA